MPADRKGTTQNDARPPRYGWSADKLPEQIAGEALQRRIAAEKAHYDRGIPTAGHDNPAREAEVAARHEDEKHQRKLDAAAVAEFRRESLRTSR